MNIYSISEINLINWMHFVPIFDMNSRKNHFVYSNCRLARQYFYIDTFSHRIESFCGQLLHSLFLFLFQSSDRIVFVDSLCVNRINFWVLGVQCPLFVSRSKQCDIDSITILPLSRREFRATMFKSLMFFISHPSTTNENRWTAF